MILVDANLLLYAQVPRFPQHSAARLWLDAQLNGALPVGLPWESLLAYLRVVTNPRVFERPQPVASAWRQVEEWLERPPVWIPEPTPRHREILGKLLIGGRAGGNLASDARLAALAIEHGLTLYSADTDFARFTGLRWVNPLRTSAGARTGSGVGI
ncbi:MAG: type II toxin-antitoxin system VapC family toxin [Acidobacteria bacterium]|nr:type II toxin-antitoxin system VapC family toxin [Acidobacteriota bacterium]